MLLSLKQILKKEDCLSCKGCCEFDEGLEYFSALFSESEFELINKIGIDIKLFNRLNANTWQVKLTKIGNIFYCLFLNINSRKCKIYKFRPFDCRIYPFILMWDKGRKNVVLGVFKRECLQIAKKIETTTCRKYLDYLRNYLNSNKTVSFIKKSPRLVWEYDEDATILFNINKLTESLIKM